MILLIFLIFLIFFFGGGFLPTLFRFPRGSGPAPQGAVAGGFSGGFWRVCARRANAARRSSCISPACTPVQRIRPAHQPSASALQVNPAHQTSAPTQRISPARQPSASAQRTSPASILLLNVCLHGMSLHGFFPFRNFLKHCSLKIYLQDL